MYPYVIIALDLARERAETHIREEEHRRLVTSFSTQSSRFRRPTAQVLAAFSRGSAAIVRRLDDCVADDLGRTLAPTE